MIRKNKSYMLAIPNLSDIRIRNFIETINCKLVISINTNVSYLKLHQKTAAKKSKLSVFIALFAARNFKLN